MKNDVTEIFCQFYANMFARVPRIYVSFQLQEQKYLHRKWHIFIIMFIVEEQETTAE